SGWLGASAFSLDGRWLAAADTGNRIQIWNVATGIPSGPPFPQQWVHSVAFSPDGKMVLTGSADGTACLWDVATHQLLQKFTPARGEIPAGASARAGTMTAPGGQAQAPRRWQTNNGQPLGQPLRHQGTVLAVAFSPDGQTILTGSNVNTAQLWDAKT